MHEKELIPHQSLAALMTAYQQTQKVSTTAFILNYQASRELTILNSCIHLLESRGLTIHSSDAVTQIDEAIRKNKL
ncbi:MAG: hypothetical protein WBR24_11595 [Desulfobacterales bacterium]